MHDDQTPKRFDGGVEGHAIPRTTSATTTRYPATEGEGNMVATARRTEEQSSTKTGQAGIKPGPSDTPTSGPSAVRDVDDATPYPSAEAVKAAVELEIHGALGRVQTVVIGKLIQQAIDAALAATKPEAAPAEFPTWGAEDEAYELGKRDGYESAIQELDLATGGDGEFKGSTIPGETVDVPAMKARIIRRVADEQSYSDLRASGGIFPEAYQRRNAPMTDDQIKHMADRFLMWKLPEHFNPDCGISFDPKYRSKHGPVGTNLFDALQATAMARHMVEGMPVTEAAPAVKPLEWREARSIWFQAAMCPRYEIVPAVPDGYRLKYADLKIDAPSKFGTFNTIDAAKAAAQADYEQRIKSALIVTPPAITEREKPIRLSAAGTMSEPSQKLACGYVRIQIASTCREPPSTVATDELLRPTEGQRQPRTWSQDIHGGVRGPARLPLRPTRH